MIYSSTVKIQMDEKEYQRIIQAMRGITGKSEEAIFSSAGNKTAKKAQAILSNEAKKVYRGEFVQGIRGRSTIRKGNIKNVGAEISFKSKLPNITHFYYRPKETTTRFDKTGPLKPKRLVVKIGGRDVEIFRSLGKQHTTPARGIKTMQLRAGEGSLSGDAFVSRMTRNGGDSTSVTYRKSEAENSPGTRRDRLPLRKIYGSSDRAMAGNEKVYGKHEQEINRMFLDECERQLAVALAKYGGKK